MEKETTEKKASTQEAKPKRKYRYVGPVLRKGLYLPDATTLIHPDTVTDADLDIFIERYPQLAEYFKLQ